METEYQKLSDFSACISRQRLSGASEQVFQPKLNLALRAGTAIDGALKKAPPVGVGFSRAATG
jgi:hypothetical protein